MSQKHKKDAESIINNAIEVFYPDLKVRPNTGNYILNQLMKAGYTNDKTIVDVSEIQDKLKQAVFKCRTDTNEPSSLVPDDISLLFKDPAFTKILEESKGENQQLRDILNQRPLVHLVLPGLDAPSPCGNSDYNAPVTEHDFEVTCLGCKTWLKTPANPKG